MTAATTAACDAHADWYNEFVSPAAAGDRLGRRPDLFGFAAVKD